MKPCSYCGRENDDATQSCTGCGTDLDAPATVSVRQLINRMFGRLRSLPTQSKRILLVVTALLLCALVFFGSTYCHIAKMAAPDVIQIANSVVTHDGFVLGEYYDPVARFEPFDRDRAWIVEYSPRASRPGRPVTSKNAHAAPRFFVKVEDKTGHARVILLQEIGEGKLELPQPGYGERIWVDSNAWNAAVSNRQLKNPVR